MISRIVSKIKGLSQGAKSSIVFTFASLFTNGLAIITVPIFTRIMSSSEIGTVNIYNSWFSMISVIATLSLTSGGYMVALKEFPDKRNQYVSSVLSLTSLVAMVLAFIFALFPHFWSNLLGMSVPMCVLMLFGFFVTPATNFWLARERYEYKYKAGGIVTISAAILSTAVSLIAVLIAKDSYELGTVRIFAGNLVTYIVASVIYIKLMISGKEFVNLNYWRYSLKLSIPLIGNALATQVLSVSDRTMIGEMIGKSAVGIYGTLYTVSSLSLIVWGAINSSFVPFLFENIDKKEKKQDIKKISTRLMIAYSFVALAMTIVAPEIVHVLATQEYYEAIYIMPPIAAGVFLTSLSNMYSNILIYHKKTSSVMIASVIAAVVNVVLNFFCIQIWGYMAAAYTTLIAYIILATVQGIVSRSVHRKFTDSDETVYEDNKLLAISVVTIVLCLCSIPLYYNTSIRYLIIIASLIVLIAKRKTINNFLENRIKR